MTRQEVLARLLGSRGEFDAKVAAVPIEALVTVPPGRDHSAKDIVAHVNAYEQLIVERLRSARQGETTAFDRDRDGWEVFNDRVWAQAAIASAEAVLARSPEVFAELLSQVSQLSDAELNEPVGVTAFLDPGWLDGKALWELIGIDAFEHYPMHFEALAQAAVPLR